MGQEIQQREFTPRDFEAFAARLRAETDELQRWLELDRFEQCDGVAGFELEAWLLDRQGRPTANNDRFLRELNNPLIVPELAAFNFEINNLPLPLHGDALRRMHEELDSLWSLCSYAAARLESQPLMIGTLPKKVYERSRSTRGTSAITWVSSVSAFVPGRLAPLGSVRGWRHTGTT